MPLVRKTSASQLNYYRMINLGLSFHYASLSGAEYPCSAMYSSASPGGYFRQPRRSIGQHVDLDHENPEANSIDP